MKYIIVGYTSNIDIKTNTAKVRYAKISFADTEAINQIPILDGWVDDVKEATTFYSRETADAMAEDLAYVPSSGYSRLCAISYGIED